LIVLPSRTAEPKRLAIPYPVIWLSLLVSVGFLSVFGFLFESYYGERMNQSALQRLKAENLLLHDRLRKYEVRLDGLGEKIDELATFDTELRVIADLDPIDEDIRKLGVGGSLPVDEELRTLNPPLAEKVESFSSRLDRVARQTHLQTLSFEKIESHLEKSADLRNHTPSIRPCRGWLCSGFGYRKDPFTGRRKFHDGIDIAAPIGTPVYATADGIVESIKYYNGGYGLTIVVDHGYGYKTVYAHLSLSKVQRRQRVMRGDVIGLVGRSGRTTGSHLHYEVRITGDARNPLTYIVPDEDYFD